jgi:hypothetical protein
VLPKSTEEVAAAVAFCHANFIDLAVKGGGHFPLPASSTHGGVCIDLSKMQEIVVNVEAKTIKVQGGAIWGETHAAAQKYGLGLPGGSCNQVGVGGLTLAGGHGFLSGTHGSASDNLLSVEIVLADGKVVTASRVENIDLFWAIRGAGACFGVVTFFTFQAHDQQNLVWSGMLVLPPSAIPVLSDIGNKVLDVSNKGRATLFFGFSIIPTVGEDPMIPAMIFYNGTETQGKEIFGPLLDLNLVPLKVEMKPYSTAGIDSFPEPNYRALTTGSVFLAPLDSVLIQSLYDDFAKFVRQGHVAARSFFSVEVIDFHKMMVVGQTETAFPNRGALVHIFFKTICSDEKDDAICEKWRREWSAKLRAELKRRMEDGSLDETTRTAVGEYINYSGEYYTFEARVCTLTRSRWRQKRGRDVWDQL